MCSKDIELFGEIANRTIPFQMRFLDQSYDVFVRALGERLNKAVRSTGRMMKVELPDKCRQILWGFVFVFDFQH